MPIKVVDLMEMARQPDASRQVLINGPRMHAWFHIYPNPGDKDDLHCHNGDQIFYMIDGECTMHFADGGAEVLHPGMIALITAGSFYQLENTGTGKMVLLGGRSGSSESIKHINYETRQDAHAGTKGAEPTGTRILV